MAAKKSMWRVAGTGGAEEEDAGGFLSIGMSSTTRLRSRVGVLTTTAEAAAEAAAAAAAAASLASRFLADFRGLNPWNFSH